MASVSATTPLVLGGIPTVNLLPPEVGAERAQRRLRWFITVLVIIALGIVVIAWGLSLTFVLITQGQLTSAQAGTQTLLLDQQKYSTLTKTQALLKSETAARTLLTSTAVPWSDILSELESKLPSGASVQSAAFTGRAPWDPVLTPTGALRPARVATISLTVQTSSISDASSYVEQISTEKFVADASPSSVTNDNGTYTTVIAVNLNTSALTTNETQTGTANK
jgi:Tfp pilus assembly protein PilN